MQRLIKSSVAVFAIIGAFALTYIYCYKPVYVTETKFPDSGTIIQIHRQSTHPYLAEYKRKLVIIKKVPSKIEVDLFPDYGGDARIQLYKLSPDMLLVEVRAEVVKIDLNTGDFSRTRYMTKPSKIYLGAFDKSSDHGEWTFYPARQSPQQIMAPER